MQSLVHNKHITPRAKPRLTCPKLEAQFRRLYLLVTPPRFSAIWHEGHACKASCMSISHPA